MKVTLFFFRNVSFEVFQENERGGVAEEVLDRGQEKIRTTGSETNSEQIIARFYRNAKRKS